MLCEVNLRGGGEWEAKLLSALPVKVEKCYVYKCSPFTISKDVFTSVTYVAQLNNVKKSGLGWTFSFKESNNRFG